VSDNSGDRRVAARNFDLMDIWCLVRDYRISVCASVVVLSIVAAVVAWSLTPIFRAEVVVSEVQKNDGLGRAGGVVSQFGGLADLAGLSLGADSADARKRLAILNSRALVEEFIKSEDLLPVLLGSAGPRRGLWWGVKVFRDDVLNIKSDKLTGLITVSMERPDPVEAAHWANAFVALANEVIRDRDEQTAKRNIAFLEHQLDGTKVVELQKILYGLIESQTRTVMLANSPEDYAFLIIDPAVPPEVRARPARSLIVALGAVFGLMFGVMGALVHRFARSR